MSAILENIFKGFLQWICGLCLEIVQYIANSLLDVFKMDMDYFRQVAPVTDDILRIIIAAGWALLLGNLVFQAVKSMATGLGFEGEDPKLLFTRTFVFAFLLLASQQICEIGLGISGAVIQLLQVPTSVNITVPDATGFALGASWLLVIIISFIIMWQVVRLFFEIAERYVVTAILVLLSPLAFAMGGSKNTEDIFRGWCRMFGSMCTMMVLNVVFLKLLISALGYLPSGLGVIPWMLLIVGIARVARKVDGIITRIGLNPAITGGGLGSGLPGVLALSVAKSIGSTVIKSAAHSMGSHSGGAGRGGGTGRAPGGASGGGRTPPSGPPPSGGSGGSSFTGNRDPGSGPVGGGRSGTQQQSGVKTGQTTADSQTTSQQEYTATAQTSSAGNGSGSRSRGSGDGIYRPARRTSVPPEARGQRRSGNTSPPPPPTGQGGASAKGNRQEAPPDTAKAGARDHRPDVRRETGPKAPAQGSHDHKTTAGGGRPEQQRKVSAARMAHEQTISREASTTSNSSEAVKTERTARPIHQEGTPQIKAPPGVTASGKKRTPDAGTAGTDKAPRPNRPPIGGAAPTSGTAGTAQAHVNSTVSGGMAPSPGTAGTAGASRKNTPPAMTAAPSPGTAGTAKVKARAAPSPGVDTVSADTPGTARRTRRSKTASGNDIPPAGTAGTASAPVRQGPPVNGGTVPAGTAGTARRTQRDAPVSDGVTHIAGTAGTPKAARQGTTPTGAETPPGTARGGGRRPSVETVSPPAGTAGTSRLARSGKSGEKDLPFAGTAGTAAKPTRPGINQGTRRLNQDPASVAGKPEKQSKTNRKGGGRYGP